MMHGIINVYKEKGYTSHDVVAKLRGIVGQKKIGHTGTLDPDAEGVLPVCLGRATKLCDMLTDKDKTYEAVLLLGKSTDTQDISGEVLETRDTDHLDEETVKQAILSFVGDYEQVPPMYSALKVNGKKLYELAREGKVIERKSRPVKILEIQILEMELPRVRMEVSCSKGTYIRTLCHDIGEKLGCGGCMESLLRSRVERFRLEDSHKLCEIEAMQKEGSLQDILIPIDAMFTQYPKTVVKQDWERLARNGNALPIKAVTCDSDCDTIGKMDSENKESAYVRLYNEAGDFIAIYRRDGKEYQIVKMFFTS
jgi:tRNA pseudouridine55 synthase